LGFVFFSSASGGRSGGCRGGDDVDDLHFCWLPRQLGLLQVGFGGDRFAPMFRWRPVCADDGLWATMELAGGGG
jgi:hypothetical protein